MRKSEEDIGVDYVLTDYGLKSDAALVLDAGPESLYLGASGILWGKITVKGKQGHAGYPSKPGTPSTKL